MMVAALLMTPLTMWGQSYQAMWKQVEEAQEKDLPKTALSHLQKIEAKAIKESAYGHLLKSTLLHARLQAEIAPDSLAGAVARIAGMQSKDEALQAVYDAVLSIIYRDNRQLTDDSQAKSKDYARRAMAHPEVLAAVKTDAYVPFVIKGKDSEIFGHDLLSVIGEELNAWQDVYDYYAKTGNRRAACLAALHIADNIGKTDSLIALYGDLPEAGELAIRRYEQMEEQQATPVQKAAWLQESLRRWGTWQRANSLRNSWSELTQPRYRVEIEKHVAELNKEQSIYLKGLCHLQNLTIRVYRTQLTGETLLNPQLKDDYQKMKAGLTELKEMQRTLTFSGHEDYDVFEDSLQLAGLAAGVYLLEFSTQPQTETLRMLYFASGLRVIMEAQPGNQVRYVVVDATTGQPVGRASLRLRFSRRGNEQGKLLMCNDKGEVEYRYENNKMPVEVYAFTNFDKYCPKQNAYGSYSYYENRNHYEQTSVFTDRSIYRPGQTVQVAAIVWKQQSEIENVAVADKRVKIELRDANYKLVSEQQVTTDQYGKCHTQFTLPTGLLNGRFSIRANNRSFQIRVEEYKRPTFQVEFADYQEAYQNGDTVHAKGKATTYAGVPVQGAKVKYTVRRKVAFWWMTYSRYWQQGYLGRGVENEVMNEGETVTADDGTFTVDMPMRLPEDLKNQRMFYHFTVEADVTDMAGETHSGTMSLPLGNRPTALTCDIPQQVRSDELPKVTFNRYNAAGKEIAGQVKYRLDEGKWQKCEANCQLSIVNYQLKSGSHRLEAVCEGDTVKADFIVFSLDDKKPAATTSDWWYLSHHQFPNDGSPVTLQVGSSDPDLHIVYGIFAGDKMIESGSVDKNAALVNRKFTYDEEYGNGLLVTYAWVKNGVCHTHQDFIQRPMPDKQLKMTWATFRDRLTPGQEEQWSLKVQHPDGTPADASLMAVLYDKSLDAIAPHQWSFSPSNYLSRPSTGWHGFAWNGFYESGEQDYESLTVRNFDFSRFDDSVYPYYTMIRSHGPMFSRAAAPTVMMRTNATSDAVDEVMVVGYAEEKAVTMTGAVALKESAAERDASEEPKEQEEVQLRENLSETAFCYPALVTDKEGNVMLKFTLPESLTTWRFMSIANTTDMSTGYLGGEAVATKEVMVQPNMPRFIRVGDQTTLTGRVFNTSDKTVSGNAKLQLIDPETQVVIEEQNVPFSVEAGKTTTVTFDWTVNDMPALMICKMSVSGEGFSDGEQHYLPVLPDREYVTKTIPYTQHEPGVKTIDLSKFFPANTTKQQLTVEYTNNPAWLMVQSLPVIGQPCEHSAIDQAASYYSNLLAKTLLDKSPQVKTVFEQWKQDANLSPLASNLSKNQELKDLVLQETPWVNAADRESEQKQRLADFFDKNGIDNRLNMAVEKLKKLQNADGSFSWYPGMEGCTSITVAVEEMLVRLNKMAGEQSDISVMQTRAFDYIGQEMVKLVKEMKKAEKKGHKPTFPSFTALRWLYLCALDGRVLMPEVKSANNYLIVLLKKDIKRQTIYEKALTAVVLAKCGENKKAAEYVKSLKEYTVYTEEMGRYYDSPRASYSWYDYKIPTEVAAIEAIRTVTPDDTKTTDEMCRWLLQEKRTQAWDTPINSVNAIYAFLDGGKQTLATTQPQTTLAIDNQPIELPQATAGIGYVKTAIQEPKGNTFTATKTSEGTSWGAVYAQFFQKATDIEASQSGISIKREIISNHNSQFKVGDRIRVRITIESTRDLDFVQVVDHKAACMEAVNQLSGYRNGAYVSPKDAATHYFFHQLAKGKHVVETEYYIDRAGRYETGTCTAGCAYAPEYRAIAPSMTINVK